MSAKTSDAQEVKNLQSSSTDNDQGDKTTANVDNLNQVKDADSLLSAKSSNEDKKSDETSSTSNEQSDINIKNSNEKQKPVATTTSEQEVTSSSSTNMDQVRSENNTSKLDTSNLNTNEDSKKDESKAQTAASNATTADFSIHQGDAQHLTDFQRQKAKYFFNVNLDIENKEYVTWEDVEFYLLFHLTAAGKEGSDSGDLEGRLSRATRAFWEHIHDQIPLPDGKRDTLTLDQFLDTWASLVDYVVRTNQLPPRVQELVKHGFELYSTDDKDGKSPTIQPTAFDQLFQKMNLGRPHAIMAYQFLTENGTKSLDADKIESIVKAVITSSDDEHDSHFLLPGFFNTISSNKNKEDEKKSESSSPTLGKQQSVASDKFSSTPTSSTTSKPSNSATPDVKQSNESSSPSSQKQKPSSPLSSEKRPSSASQNGFRQPSAFSPSNNRQSSPATPSKDNLQQEDENIRRLLRFYHIDDGDVVEIADGSVKRVVLVHPERPLPPYIQQNENLLRQLQPDSTYDSPLQQNRLNDRVGKSSNIDSSSTEPKPKVTLGERISRDEAQKGPSVPLGREQTPGNSFSTGVHQVYPQLSKTQQEEQRKQAKLQASQPVNDEQEPTDEKTSANDLLSSKQDNQRERKDLTRDEEEKLVASVLRQLTPIVEKRVAAEIQRIQSGEAVQDEDNGFMPFPFMFATGGSPVFASSRAGPPPQAFRRQQQPHQQNVGDQEQQQQQQQPPNEPSQADFGGLPPDAAFIPPQLLMAMMNDLTRGAMGGEIPIFPPNMPPPSRGPGGAPMGVEGFMMFVDDNPFMGGPAGFPQRPERRF